jgi:hypothetical protein
MPRTQCSTVSVRCQRDVATWVDTQRRLAESARASQSVCSDDDDEAQDEAQQGAEGGIS